MKEKSIKKTSKPIAVREMRAEYDFSKATRGKAYKPLHEGYTVSIRKSDGTTVVENYKLEHGTVMLQPDVQEYFPDSESVNAALRALIAILPEKRNTTSKKSHRLKHAQS